MVQQPITFDEYDKITDILLYLSNNLTLSFTVNLSRKGKNKERIFFQYETEFRSKYIGTDTGRSIKRVLSFYFSIDNREDFNDGLMLKPQDVYILNSLIENRVLPWFFDARKRIFHIVENNRLVIKGSFERVVYTQNEYRYISFIPIVYSYDNNIYKEGIRLYLNSEYNYADLDIDKFMGFAYILKNTDMYTAACALANYAKMPPHGLNIYGSSVGLGSGHAEDPWPESTIDEYRNTKKNGSNSNNFLSNVGKKEEDKK